jgi:hypothetical protein
MNEMQEFALPAAKEKEVGQEVETFISSNRSNRIVLVTVIVSCTMIRWFSGNVCFRVEAQRYLWSKILSGSSTTSLRALEEHPVPSELLWCFQSVETTYFRQVLDIFYDKATPSYSFTDTILWCLSIVVYVRKTPRGILLTCWRSKQTDPSQVLFYALNSQGRWASVDSSKLPGVAAIIEEYRKVRSQNRLLLVDFITLHDYLGMYSSSWPWYYSSFVRNC